MPDAPRLAPERLAGRILSVDDDLAQAETYARVLRREGYGVETAADADQALRLIDAAGSPDLVLADLRLTGVDGIELLKAVRRRDPLVEVLVLTAYGSIESAVEAVRAGAYDFLLKPVDRERLVSCVRKALEHRALVLENRSLRRVVRGRAESDPLLVGSSAPLRAVLDLVERVAPTDASVLLCGESGTGKSLVARLLHERSARSAGPFVSIACGALPETLLEAELFGHERGAFTGAWTRRRGRIEQTDGGTLFLDEVGEIPLAVQVKLLRVIQDREFERVGGEETLRSDFRLLAATNADLRQAVEERRFREDLYYRIKVVEIELPPLRSRPDDIPLLVRHFVRLHAARSRKRVQDVSAPAMTKLQQYSWPGNVRELDHVVERAVVLTRHERIEIEDLPALAAVVERSRPEEVPPDDALLVPPGMRLRDVQRLVIEQTIKRCEGSVRQAARRLGISERTIHRKRHGEPAPGS